MSNGASQRLHRLKSGKAPPHTHTHIHTHKVHRHCVPDNLTYLVELNRLELTGHPASLKIFHIVSASFSLFTKISNLYCSVATTNSVRLHRHAENIFSLIPTELFFLKPFIQNYCQGSFEDKNGSTLNLLRLFSLFGRETLL